MMVKIQAVMDQLKLSLKRNWLPSLIFNDIALINADVRVVSEKRMKRA